jgi:hypothetical protein
VFSETHSPYALRLPNHQRLLLLLLVLAGEVFRPCPDDHYDRHHYQQPEIKQDGQRSPAPEEVGGERNRKVNRGVQQDHQKKATPGAVVHPGEDDAQREARDRESGVEGGSSTRYSLQPPRQEQR